MNPHRYVRTLIAAIAVAAGTLSSSARAADDVATAEQLEFFETRIRPVLVEACYECHNSADTAEGGLAVDHRAALLKGGDGGPILIPGDPARSRLLAIIRHEVPDLEMPQAGPKLDAQVIRDFERWIAMKAPDPRDHPPSADEVAAATAWPAVLEKRKQWWSFQPIRTTEPPPVQDGDWSDHPVDRFILAKLEQNGLQPHPQADAPTLVRRAFITLIGLPPTAEEAATWTARLQAGPHDAAFAELVDHLLDSPHFGERWARHWMDWIRYAESHGSEGDPAIHNAWIYRDYLIRALNADVPYDQLLREHVAGDLLPQPRRNTELGINESAIGPVHWRMVFHGFAPTDPLDEKVRFTDDQINAFSKAFLGLTVSCARCHDHKFDAISQRDYYAMFGILGACRPARQVIDLPERQALHAVELSTLKPQIRTALAEAWRQELPSLTQRLTDGNALPKSADEKRPLLKFWKKLMEDGAAGDIAGTWERRRNTWQIDARVRRDFESRDVFRRWRFDDANAAEEWFANGYGLASGPSAPGEFAVTSDGDRILSGIFPAGVYSHGLSAKHAARLTSPDISLGDEYELHLKVIGDGGATSRFVVQNYPRNGTVYPVTKLAPQWRDQRYDLTYWNGDRIHIELAAGLDAPLLVDENPRSWFGIREAVIVRKGAAVPPIDTQEFLDPLFDVAGSGPPESLTAAATLLTTAIGDAVEAWQAETMNDSQAMLLSACLEADLLSNGLEQLPQVRPLVEEYRRLEADIPVPTRVPGLDPAVDTPQPLYIRGNHKQPGEMVAHRFLEAIDPTPYDGIRSDRLQLADDLLRSDNPLTRRVIVNRIWHHLFGRGIVGTPDNFGRLGMSPTHPELLDALAVRFSDDGWSLKRMMRFLMTSRTWQLSSSPGEQAREIDPDNRLWSHARVRRMEAEVVRDAMLSVAGQLDRRQFGPPVGGYSRRCIYLPVRRNALDPFLRTFDFPEPFSTTGSRDVTNVPAQSLLLLNDDAVAGLAQRWAGRILSDPQADNDETHARTMFLAAFGRDATTDELARVMAYLNQTRDDHQRLQEQLAVLRKQADAERQAITEILGPARRRLVEAAQTPSESRQAELPEPIAAWSFDTDLHDEVGTMHGTAFGDAGLVDGAVHVDGRQGYVLTAPLTKTVREKTLSAWVRLDSLDQQGGGVMTLQSADGVVFDAIVFGEREPKRWLAGSNNWRRTQPLGGDVETTAQERAVHIAITYEADGRITAYRDGVPYGQSYEKDGPIEFQAGKAVVTFGLRHLPAVGNRFLAGHILEAQLFDTALSPTEVQAVTQASGFISDADVWASLAPNDRQTVESARMRLAEKKADIEALGPVPETFDESSAWTTLTRSVLTFKEFIYYR